MSVDLYNSLLITLLGMGLVFAAILLLWAVMAVLVKLAPERPQALDLDEKPELERQRQAAAAAVAVALAKQKESQEPQLFPEPPTALVSAWQAVMRTKMLNKRGPTR